MKKILFFSVLLSFSLFLRAQFSSMMVEDVNLGGDAITIVRNMSNSEVITYLHGIGTHRFTYENSSTLSYKFIDLPSQYNDIRVNDFRIINGIVFFVERTLVCGTQ